MEPQPERPNWLRSQWLEIRGNAKWALCAGFAALAVKIMSWAKGQPPVFWATAVTIAICFAIPFVPHFIRVLPQRIRAVLTFALVVAYVGWLWFYWKIPIPQRAAAPSSSEAAIQKSIPAPAPPPKAEMPSAPRTASQSTPELRAQLRKVVAEMNGCLAASGNELVRLRDGNWLATATEKEQADARASERQIIGNCVKHFSTELFGARNALKDRGSP
jgi:hypothetical protein